MRGRSWKTFVPTVKGSSVFEHELKVMKISDSQSARAQAVGSKLRKATAKKVPRPRTDEQGEPGGYRKKTETSNPSRRTGSPAVFNR